MQENNKPPATTPASNPYASAAQTYGRQAQVHAADPRELEARVLLKSAQRLQALRDDWGNMTAEALDDVLRYNRQIWMMFVDTAIEDKSPDRPMSLRNNIANLGMFIFRHSVELLANPKKEKLDVLIDINREIAAGLMTKPKTEPPPAQK